MISLDLINEFDFIKSNTNPVEGYIYDCYGIRYEKNLLIPKNKQKIPFGYNTYGFHKIPQISIDWGEELIENLFVLKKHQLKKRSLPLLSLVRVMENSLLEHGNFQKKKILKF